MKRLALLALLLGGAEALAQSASRDAFSPEAYRSLFWPTWGAPLHAPLLRTWVSGWVLTGSNPGAYEVRCQDPAQGCIIPLLRTRFNAGSPLGTGSLTHSETAGPWQGHKVVVRAELKAGSIGGWGALWMRVDGPDDAPLAFDNMQNRPLRGTSAFDWYRVVLDVPPEAVRITFGVMLHGPGAIFIRELQFEEADPDEPSTDLIAPLRAQARSTGGAAAPSAPAAR